MEQEQEQEWLHGQDQGDEKEIKYLKPLFTQLNDPVIIKPESLDDPTTGDDTVYKEEVRQYIKDKKKSGDNFSIFVQCSVGTMFQAYAE